MAMRFKRTSDCIVLLLGFLMSVVDLCIEPLLIAPNDLCQPLHFTPDDLLFVSGPAGS